MNCYILAVLLPVQPIHNPIPSPALPMRFPSRPNPNTTQNPMPSWPTYSTKSGIFAVLCVLAVNLAGLRVFVPSLCPPKEGGQNNSTKLGALVANWPSCLRAFVARIQHKPTFYDLPVDPYEPRPPWCRLVGL
jgi:hypothetical protein